MWNPLPKLSVLSNAITFCFFYLWLWYPSCFCAFARISEVFIAKKDPIHDISLVTAIMFPLKIKKGYWVLVCGHKDLWNTHTVCTKIQQTKILLWVKVLLICFYLGWSGSILQFRQNMIKVGSKQRDSIIGGPETAIILWKPNKSLFEGLTSVGIHTWTKNFVYCLFSRLCNSF